MEQRKKFARLGIALGGARVAGVFVGAMAAAIGCSSDGGGGKDGESARTSPPKDAEFKTASTIEGFESVRLVTPPLDVPSSELATSICTNRKLSIGQILRLGDSLEERSLLKGQLLVCNGSRDEETDKTPGSDDDFRFTNEVSFLANPSQEADGADEGGKSAPKFYAAMLKFKDKAVDPAPFDSSSEATGQDPHSFFLLSYWFRTREDGMPELEGGCRSSHLFGPSSGYRRSGALHTTIQKEKTDPGATKFCDGFVRWETEDDPTKVHFEFSASKKASFRMTEIPIR